MTELMFKGKEFVWNHHLAVPFRPLITQPDKGIGDARLDGNLIVQGDNLHALKALLPMYAGEVDCIFIDPPYNTGNEGWSYNDNVNAPMIREWLDANPIGVEDGLRHDKWCAMMWPRLRLLQQLLAETGMIAVAIDNNEIDSLLQLMDEAFGADNRLAIACWLSDPSGGKQKSALRTGHEYIVFYGGGDPELTKQVSAEIVLNLEDSIGEYAKGRELNKWGANSHRRDRETMFFPLTAPDGTVVYPIRNDGKEGCWRFGKDNKLMKQLEISPDPAHWEIRPFDDGVVVNGKTERWVPYEKLRDPDKAFGWSTWLAGQGSNADGTAQLKAIFGTKVFETPKPKAIVDYVLGVCGNENAIVLDSFAGSGTTGHAVLDANQRDNGNRRFILVEMEDYADQLTAERLRRVINGYDFTGTQRTELLREKLSWSKLQKADKLTEKVQAVETLHGHAYNRIKKEVKGGELIVTGEKRVETRAEGLGGAFTYCTLGEPVDLDHILTGKDLPSYDALAGVLFHMATSQPLDPATTRAAAYYVGAASGTHVWLMYQPDLDWLKSPSAALTLSFAKQISATDDGARHLVFAPARHVSQRMLDTEGLAVEFVPLPFALYRMAGD